MAVRTVSVELKMKISDFELAAAKAAATTKLLGDEFDNLGKTSSKFSTAKPTKEMQNFSRVIDGAMKDGKTGFQSIQSAIDDTKTHITKLKDEFRTSGSSSVFGDLKSAQKDLRTLEKVFKEIAPVAEKAGINAGNGLLNGLESSISSFQLGPLAGPIGIGIIAVAAPIIISGVAAALSTGAGLGIIGMAAVIEHNNPVIVRAFGRLSGDVKDTLSTAADGLVGPLAGGLATFDKFIRDEGPALKAMFAAVGPDIQLVVGGIDKLAGDLIPAMTRAAQSFGDAIKDPAVQKSLGLMETSFIQLFDSLGNNPRLVKEGFIALDVTLGTTFTIVQGLAIAATSFGDALHYVDVAAGEMNTHAKFLTAVFSPFASLLGTAGKEAQTGIGLFTGLGTAITQMSSAAQAAGGDLQSLSQQINATEITSDTLAGQMTDKLMSGMLNADMATNNFNKSLITLGDDIVAVGGHLTEHVKSLKKMETGQQQETDAVFAAIQANLQVYDSQIAVGISAEDAARAYDKNSASLNAQVHAAGKVPPAVQKLIDKYAHVPAKVNTIIAMQGLTDAIDNLNSTLLLLSHIDGFHAKASVTTTYYTKGDPHTGPLSRNRSRWGGVYTHADEGLVHAKIQPPTYPAQYAYAEPQTGGEAFIPKHGDYGRSMSILSAAAGWYGARVVDGGGRSGGGGNTQIVVSAAPGFQQAFLQFLRFTIKDGGGDVVRVLTPK